MKIIVAALPFERSGDDLWDGISLQIMGRLGTPCTPQCNVLQGSSKQPSTEQHREVSTRSEN